MKSKKKVLINNTCTVFGQQEVVARLSEGEAIEDIVAGLCDAIASRVISMVRRLKVEPDVVFTGGVAKNIGVARAIKEKLGQDVFVPEEPLLSGALGAALLAKETVAAANEKGEPLERGKHRLEEATFFD
jgi:activator of 2-hydroxyglutaryl-CoA dehydratase